jgi:antitoxin CptB
MALPSETLSLLRWRARRGLLENDLIIERFFERFADQLQDSDLEPLTVLFDLSDNDLLDLLLSRKKPEGELANEGVHRILAMMKPVRAE